MAIGQYHVLAHSFLGGVFALLFKLLNLDNQAKTNVFRVVSVI